MSGFVILIVVFLIAGIILLSSKSPFKKKTREQFLADLTKFLEGTLEPIEDEAYPNSFRIRFKFSGKDFIFEDLEKQGFKDKVNTSYLKIQTSSRLTLTFTEKKKSTKIRTDIFIASDISTQSTERTTQLQSPKHLGDLNVLTNDTVAANKVFENKKISSIFKQLKNVDSRGYSSMPIGIVEGGVTLEFYSEKMFQPSLTTLYSDISFIEDYLNKLLVFVSVLEKEL